MSSSCHPFSFFLSPCLSCLPDFPDEDFFFVSLPSSPWLPGLKGSNSWGHRCLLPYLITLSVCLRNKQSIYSETSLGEQETFGKHCTSVIFLQKTCATNWSISFFSRNSIIPFFSLLPLLYSSVSFFLSFLTFFLPFPLPFIFSLKKFLRAGYHICSTDLELLILQSPVPQELMVQISSLFISESYWLI